MTVPPPPPGEADDEEQETVLREFIVPPSDLFGDDAAATPEPAGTPAKQSPEDLEATRLRPARVVAALHPRASLHPPLPSRVRDAPRSDVHHPRRRGCAGVRPRRGLGVGWRLESRSCTASAAPWR